MNVNTPDAPHRETPRIVNSFPATEAQLEIWLHSQLSREANCGFNETATLSLQGPLDIDALRLALEQTMIRNEMLRAAFSADGQTVLIQDRPACEFQFCDWSDESEEVWRGHHQAAVAAQGNRPFDLARGPLLRVRLSKLSDDLHLVTFTAHHIIMDGWSVFVFCRDLGHLYSAIVTGTPADLPAAELYESYSLAMHNYEFSGQGEADEEYWVSQFQDAIPVLDLPTDRPRPALKTFASQRFDYRIEADQVALLRKAGAKCGCSLFNFALAGLHAFLARISGQDDFVIGIPTAGQAAMDFQNLIGHCVNTVPFRARIDLDQPVSLFAKQIRNMMLDTLEHQRYTFGRLVRKLAPPRDPSRPAIFSVMMNIDPAVDEQELGFADLRVRLLVEPRTFENFEWFISGAIDQAGALELQCQFNSDLFERATIGQYLEGFEAFLGGMAKSLDKPLSEVPVMSIPQRQRMIVEWNDTAATFSATTVHAEFVRQAAETPTRPALSCGKVTLNYRQLDDWSSQIAVLLGARGVGPGDRVGICLPRGTAMVASALGIWKAGAAYVPLDPDYPADRLQYVCADAAVKLILVDTNEAAKLGEFAAISVSLSELESSSSRPLPAGPAPAASESSFEPPTRGTPADVAYVIYTSGSTGQPKGVQVPHGCVVNFLRSMQAKPGFTADDRLLAITTMSFDISILELFLPLVCGAEVRVADLQTATDGNRLREALERHEISILQATPVTWRMLLEAGWQRALPIRALCGGEPFPRDLVAPLLARCREVWNMYGPTETTVWSSLFRIHDAREPVCIGRPIANTQLYVLDSKMQELPMGATGELFIGGAGVTLGYLNREELTATRYVENPYYNPFAEYANHHLYRTGDLVRYRTDGNLEFLRRNDKQVKVRGHRIELGEIEHHLSTHAGLRQVVVIVREDVPGDSRLVAYYVTVAGQTVTGSDLRLFLREKLPAFMVPQHFVELDAVPQTDNGKTDVKRLPIPGGVLSEIELVAPRTPEERLLAGIWQEVLQIPEVSVTENFFNIGGHSLLVMRVLAQIEQATGVRLSPQDFLLGTLEQLAHKLVVAAARLPGGFDSAEAGHPLPDRDPSRRDW